MSRHGADERGAAVTVYMVGVAMVIFLLGGLAIDLWRAVAAERALATAVDAAAAAGANGVDEAEYRASGTVQLDPGRAQSLAADVLSQQPPYGDFDTFSVSATTAVITVSAEMPIPLTLTRIFLPGRSTRVGATATARPEAS